MMAGAIFNRKDTPNAHLHFFVKKRGKILIFRRKRMKYVDSTVAYTASHERSKSRKENMTRSNKRSINVAF